MSLLGTYKCALIDATLEITESNDGNGNGSGTMTIGQVSVPVDIHYHFKDSAGPRTNLNLKGQKDDPNQYVGAAGVAYKTTPEVGIRLAGGMTNESNAISFSGFFYKS